jgi:transposase
MYDVTKLVSNQVLNYLLEILPTPKQLKRGRKRVSKEALLSGILQVLVNGVAWRKIADCGCSYSCSYRYFREIQRRGDLHLVFNALARDITDISECASDTTTVTSFRFKDTSGWDGKHKKIGTKVSLISDINGLPSDVEFGKGSKHDLRFIPKHMRNTHGRRKKILNLDKGYTSKDLRRQLRNLGTKVNMETRRNDYTAKRGPKFGFNKEKYKIRFQIERLNGWIKAFKRLRTRVEYKACVFKAFVFLALIVVLVRNYEF